MNHLYSFRALFLCAAIVVLLPLAVMLGRATNHESFETKVIRALDKAPSEMRSRVVAKLYDKYATIDSVLSEFVGKKLVGAALSRGSHFHWVIALTITALFLSILITWAHLESFKIIGVIGVFIFTAVVGIGALTVIQLISAHSAHGNLGLAGIILILPIAIAFGYYSALNPKSGLLATFLGFTLAVGILEELCKILPVLVYCHDLDKNEVYWQRILLLSIASGLGFGIAEGIMYSSDYYNGVEPWGIYGVRFLSCVSLHAIWAGSSGLILAKARANNNQPETVIGYLFLIPSVIWLSALLHGLYNTSLKMEYFLLAIIVAALGLIRLAWQVRQFENSDQIKTESKPVIAVPNW